MTWTLHSDGWHRASVDGASVALRQLPAGWQAGAHVDGLTWPIVSRSAPTATDAWRELLADLAQCSGVPQSVYADLERMETP